MPHDPGIEHEPHFGGDRPWRADPTEARPTRPASASTREAAQALHSVHDEPAIFGEAGTIIDRDWSCPACGYNLRGGRVGEPCPECGVVSFARPGSIDQDGYARWLTGQIAATPAWWTWLVCVGVILVSGPWAIFGALLNEAGTLTMVVLAPVVEEVMKIAVAAIIVETRPSWFKRSGQIIAAVVAGAAVFAAIENLLYLYVYIPNPAGWLVAYRWTVCVALHTGCTTVAGIGLARGWTKLVREKRRPTVAVDPKFLLAAMVIHGIYNGMAGLLAVTGVF